MCTKLYVEHLNCEQFDSFFWLLLNLFCVVMHDICKEFSPA